MSAVRGDGIGIEITDTVVRGIRLRHDVDGRVAAAIELPFSSYEDAAALDTLVLVHAELGSPVDPVRIAVFPRNSMMQRIDVTGRSGPELNAIRARLDRLHAINSTLLIDEGPRRWMLMIRWNTAAVRRLEVLAERAGLVDVSIEPSPLALGRVLSGSVSYARRFAAQGHAFHGVFSGGLPVAATVRDGDARPAPDLDLSEVEVPLAWFDDFLTDAALGEQLGRVDSAAATELGDRRPAPILRVVGDGYPLYPDADVRAPRRQAVALGAAIGAAGLAGLLRPVDMIASVVTGDEQYDRPWAIERLSDLPEVVVESAPSSLRRLRRRFGRRRN